MLCLREEERTEGSRTGGPVRDRVQFRDKFHFYEKLKLKFQIYTSFLNNFTSMKN
jgi:hypothetical protein